MRWERRYRQALHDLKRRNPEFRMSFHRLPLLLRAWRSLTYRPTYRDMTFLSPTSSTVYIDLEAWDDLSAFVKYGQIRFLGAYFRKRRERGRLRFYVRHLRPDKRDDLLSHCYFEVVKTYVERFLYISHPHLVRLVDLMWIDFDLATRSRLYVWVRKVAAYLKNHPDYEAGKPSQITLDSLGDHGKL